MANRIFSLLLLLALVTPTLAVKPGEMVVIKENAELKISGKVVGQVKEGELLKVHAVRGAWVEVGEKTKGWVRTANVSSQDDALTHVTKLLEESPDNVALLITRARIYLSTNALEAAKIDLDQAQRADPTNAEPWFYLAQAALRRDNQSGAITLLDKAITLKDDDWRFYQLRGQLNQQRRVTNSAIDDFEKVADLGHADAATLNNLAWWRATHPDAQWRNGASAVKHALKACETTHYKNYMYVDTLAAAYAEFGDFKKAIEWQEEAVRLVGDTDFSAKTQCESRLKQYQLNQPYRETPR